MHAVDTHITPGSSTAASPEEVQVTPAQSQGGEKEWSHPADMDGWVKVREQELYRRDSISSPSGKPLLADQALEPQTCTLQAAPTGLAF